MEKGDTFNKYDNSLVNVTFGFNIELSNFLLHTRVE